MYLSIPAAGPEPYRRLKALRFTPEADLTLATLPVNEFMADIITEDSVAVGGAARLYDDRDRLWADYIVVRSERLDRQTLRVTAQSPLTLLDRWTLPAEMFREVRVKDFVNGIFNCVPASGYIYNVDIDVEDHFNDVAVTGFCPEQTARQRLQWLCLTVGALVRQCFAPGLRLIPAPDVDAAAYYAPGTLIPIGDTFWKPSVTLRSLVRSVRVTGCEGFTDIDPGETAIRWESVVDGQGVRWWYMPVDWTFTNEAVPELPGRAVAIDGVTLIGGEAARQVLGWLSSAHFRMGEIRMDVVNNGEYWPGQKVRVYVDEGTICTGYIQSCEFSFGLQARSRLVISSDLRVASSGTLTIRYRCGDLPLGKTVLVLPEGEGYDVANPVISWYEGQRYVEYRPTTPRSAGTTDAVVQYAAREPARIEIVTVPNRLDYMDGDALEYDGLVVRAYDREGEPWTQGGLFPEGYIPLHALTLPKRQADMGSVRMDKRVSDLNIRPSIPPVEVGSYCCRIIDPVAHHYRPDYRYKSEYSITGGLLTTNVHRNEDGTFHGFFRYILAADSPDASIEYTETRVNGEIAEHTVFHPRYEYTYRNRKVWYSSGGEAIAYDDNIYIGPVTDHVSPMSSGDPAGPTAWTMIYGDIIEGKEPIPVQWAVPGTDTVLEDSFDITVRPGGLLPEEAEA